MKLHEITKRKNFNFSCIYKFTNLMNGKVYIGQTQDFGMRMTRYKGNNFTNPHFSYAVEKYGIDNFDIEILERDIPFDKLNEREQYWIDFYESYNQDKGYNILRIAGSSRGHVAWNKGVPATQEHRENISKGLYRYYSEHTVWNKGIPATEEAKEKNRQANLGEKNGMWGRHHSQETIQKIQQRLRGRKMPIEQRRKLFRPVRCVENGLIYESESAAAEAMNCSQTNIYNAIKKGTRARGFHWEYANSDEVST